MENFSQYLPLLTSLSPLLVVVYLAVKEYRAGDKTRSKEINDNAETLIAQLREKIVEDEKRHQERMSQMDKQQKELVASYESRFATLRNEMANMEKGLIAKIAKLEGENSAKDKQLEIVNKILANRSPELDKLLIRLTELLERVDSKTDLQTNILQKGVMSDEKVANDLIQHNKLNQKRNDEIDTATEHKTGNVLRK